VKDVLEKRKSSHLVQADSFDRLLDDIHFHVGPPYLPEVETQDRWRRLVFLLSEAGSRHSDDYISSAISDLERQTDSSAISFRESRLRSEYSYVRGI
jgi:hypothetical protein